MNKKYSKKKTERKQATVDPELHERIMKTKKRHPEFKINLSKIIDDAIREKLQKIDLELYSDIIHKFQSQDVLRKLDELENIKLSSERIGKRLEEKLNEILKKKKHTH